MAYTNFGEQLAALRNGVPSEEVFAEGIAGNIYGTGNTLGESLDSMYSNWGIDPNYNYFQDQLDKAFPDGTSPFKTYAERTAMQTTPGADATGNYTHLINGSPAPGTYGYTGSNVASPALLSQLAAAQGPSYGGQTSGLHRTVNQLAAQGGSPWMAGATSAVPQFNGYTPTNGWNGRPSQGWDGWNQSSNMARSDLNRMTQRQSRVGQPGGMFKPPRTF